MYKIIEFDQFVSGQAHPLEPSNAIIVITCCYTMLIGYRRISYCISLLHAIDMYVCHYDTVFLIQLRVNKYYRNCKTNISKSTRSTPAACLVNNMVHHVGNRTFSPHQLYV